MLPKIDLSSPEFLADRRSSYRKLRDTMPVAIADSQGVESFVVTRHSDVSVVLASRRTRMQEREGMFSDHVGNGPASVFYQRAIACIDDPDHGRLRKIIGPAFTPRGIAKLQGSIIEIIEQRLDEVAGKSVIEVVEALGATISGDVVCHMLQIPAEDGAKLATHVHNITAVLGAGDLDAEQIAKSDASISLWNDYFAKILDANRGSREDDIVGLLVQAEESGTVDRDESLALFTDVFVGNYITTMVAITSAIRAFALYPEQRAALIADPGLAEHAWNEVLRFATPIHFRHRYTTEAIEIAGHRIPEGSKLLLGLASANWDERVFPDPDSFDLVHNVGKVVTFGGGAHTCIGAQVSKMEGKLFLPRFLERFPNYEIADIQYEHLDHLSLPFDTGMSITRT